MTELEFALLSDIVSLGAPITAAVDPVDASRLVERVVALAGAADVGVASAEPAAAREAAEAGSVADAVRLGSAGEAAVREAARASDSDTARAVDNRAAREGFGLLALEMFARPDGGNDLARDEAFVSALRGRLLLEAATLHATLSLHARAQPFERVVRTLSDHTGLDAAACERIAAESLRDPLAGIGYLGYLELRALVDELAEGRPRHSATRLLRNRLLGHPGGRPRDVARLALTRD